MPWGPFIKYVGIFLYISISHFFPQFLTPPSLKKCTHFVDSTFENLETKFTIRFLREMGNFTLKHSLFFTYNFQMRSVSLIHLLWKNLKWCQKSSRIIPFCVPVHQFMPHFRMPHFFGGQQSQGLRDGRSQFQGNTADKATKEPIATGIVNQN